MRTKGGCLLQQGLCEDFTHAVKYLGSLSNEVSLHGKLECFSCSGQGLF